MVSPRSCLSSSICPLYDQISSCIQRFEIPTHEEDTEDEWEFIQQREISLRHQRIPWIDPMDLVELPAQFYTYFAFHEKSPVSNQIKCISR